MNMKKLIILSGPSCVGKSPLLRAFRENYPALAAGLRRLVLYNDRPPRPGEKDGVDYHFRTAKFIRSLKKRKGFVVMKVRGDLQALDLGGLKEDLGGSDMIFEGNPFIGKALITHPYLKKVKKTSVFMAPLSKEEIALFKKRRPASLKSIVAGIMREKLVKRTLDQKGRITPAAMRDIGIRARSAYGELKEAYRYGHIIPNHDGEDSCNWKTPFSPVGEARLSLIAFADILKGKEPRFAEKWGKGLL